MPTYRYIAKDAAGRSVEGALTAENQRIVLTRLDEMGLFPVEVREADVAQEAARSAGGRVRRSQLCLFTRELADLLAGGVPLARALDTLSRQAGQGVLAAVVASVKNEVHSGRSLADALAMHPQVFPPVYVNMVRAGEEGGFLDDALERLADFLDRQQELASRVRSALAYPVLLVCVGGLTVSLLVAFAVPVLAETFRDMGGSLPAPTRLLIALSDFLHAHWLTLAAVLVVLALVARQLLSTEAGLRARDELALRLPAWKRLTTRLGVARFARTLGALLSSGVPILDALALARESTGNRVFADAIEAAAEQVRAGQPLAAELGKHACFPPAVIDMIAVGEESGRLGPCLLRIADRHERELDNALRVFVALLEPSILIVLGGFVLFIVLAMLLPVFTMNTLVM